MLDYGGIEDVRCVHCTREKEREAATNPHSLPVVIPRAAALINGLWLCGTHADRELGKLTFPKKGTTHG